MFVVKTEQQYHSWVWLVRIGAHVRQASQAIHGIDLVHGKRADPAVLCVQSEE